MTVKITQPIVNVREELKSVSPQSTPSVVNRKNLLHNGGFTISQRGDYSSATGITNGTYYLDRWKTDFSGVTASIQNGSSTLPNGKKVKTLKFAATNSAAGYMQIHQQIELEDWMIGQQFTVSAWVRSSKQNTQFRIEQSSHLNSGTPTSAGNNEWEYITYTFTHDGNTSMFRPGIIMWANAAIHIQSGDYFEIANFQCELGGQATEFEYRKIEDELAVCQRFFQEMDRGAFGIALGTSTILFSLPLVVEMRSVPTVSLSTNKFRIGDMVSVGSEFTSASVTQNSYRGTTIAAVTLNGTVSANLTTYRTYLLEPQSGQGHAKFFFSADF